MAGIDRAADRVVAQRLAPPLGMEATQRAQAQLGWGDLVIANRLAQATGFPSCRS